MIVRFEDTLFAVMDQPKHARLFDRRADHRNRFEQRHLSATIVRSMVRIYPLQIYFSRK